MLMQIYNSLSRQKEPLRPIEANKVRIYVCGMTVYDYCHLGHGRVLVVFDMVTRYLRARGYEVTYVRNITDIDDKIIHRAAENGEDFNVLTQRFIQAMAEDAEALGVLPPDEEPRATAHMDQILTMIQALMDKDFAYLADNGDVYYRVRRFDGYGALSGESLDDLKVGARVEADEAKQDPLDFVLWKAAKPGEPSWPTPWGAGRPGWHIECSAMSTHCLGNHFDIHGGGQDLRFPHHDNEIAQSEAATGKTFVNLWMHNGFVRINEEKMSKSLGNFFTIREILTRYDPEVVRYFILTSQYRSPLNYADGALENAKAGLTGYYIALNGLSPGSGGDFGEYGQRFYAAMDDDFNTPEAFAVLADLRHQLNAIKESGEVDKATHLAGVLMGLGAILGLFQQSPQEFLQSGSGAGDDEGGLSDEQIQQHMDARDGARKNKDWAEADRIRDVLLAANIILEDRDGVTTWRRN